MGLKLHLKRARKEKKNVDLWGINSNIHAIYIVTAYVIQMFVSRVCLARRSALANSMDKILHELIL